MATRKDRDLPAYVRVFVGAETGGGHGSELAKVDSFGGDDEGRLGIEGVRSMRTLEGLPIEESVFERASMRLASFVGDESGEEVGVTDSKMSDKSFATPG